MKALNILIFEDEAISALSLQMELKLAGHQVCQVVGRGERALQLVDQEQPDLVLMDLRLKGPVDGFEVTSQISSQFDIPVILMTGYPDPALIAKIVKMKNVRYLSKPIRTEDLLKTIEAFFRSGMVKLNN
ncbi:response regulator [bacterium]|nr:response regulator [bacterium]